MDRKKFLELLNNNAPLVAFLLGITTASVYGWRKNGVPHYWYGIINNLTDDEIRAAEKAFNAQKRRNLINRKKG